MIENLVSIITPTYNCGGFISETIKSIQSQTYKSWEMIIVDDCSNDDTKSIVSDLAKNDKRIKYICLERNSGAAVARNIALKEARGRWIAFLDSDDLWKPEKLERQVAFMIENNYQFSYTAYCEINEEGQSLNKFIWGPNKITRLGMIFYCWPGCLTVMYDAKKLGLTQIPDIKKNNDYAMWLKISKHADCYLLNENLACYRKRSGSISNHSYLSLIKWHYRLFRTVEGKNPILSFMFTANNLFWGLFKKFLFVEKHAF